MSAVAHGSSVELRPYQREAVDAVHEAVARGVQRCGIGLPTGTGKTIVFSQLAFERGYPALILAHRDELIQQAAEKFAMVDPSTPVGIVKAGLHQADLPVVVASVQTLARERRLHAMPTDYRTVIVDEGHHSAADTYRRILRYFSEVECHTLVSATLERADKKALSSVIDEIVYSMSLPEAIEQAWLTDIRALGIRVRGLHMGQVKVVSGDYQGKAVEEALIAAGAERVAVQAWQEHADGRKTVLFAPGVESAIRFADAFNEAGVRATFVHGGLEMDDRRGRLRAFADGEFSVVSNAMLLTEGWDEPSVECIVNARPTRSKGLYIQMIGRGTRLYPGKKELLVLDLVGNEERLDLISVPRLFGADPDKVAKMGAAAAARQQEYERTVAPLIAAGLSTLELEAKEADVFSRKDLNWLRLANGDWFLQGQRGTLYLEQAGSGWSAVLRPHDGRPPLVFCEDKDLSLAMGIAEDKVVRKAKMSTLVLIDKTQPWRAEPASPQQKQALSRMRIPFAHDITKGDASDLISAAKLSRGQHRRDGGG